MDAPGTPGPYHGGGGEAGAGAGAGAGANSIRRVSSSPTASPNASPPPGSRPAPHCSRRPFETERGWSAWTSKLVESPSRLLSSIFRRSSAVSSPPQALPEVHAELKDEAPEIISVDVLPGVEDREGNGKNILEDHPDNRGFTDLSQQLQKKTFSRTLKGEVSPVKDYWISIMQDHEEKETISPVELAKAYMSSRPPKPSLYIQSVRSKVLKEVASLPRVAHFETKLSYSSSTPISTYSKFLHTRSQIQRSQHKSSPYGTTRPYPGTSPVATKISDSSDGIAGPSTSQWTPLKANHSSGKQVRKRRWSDLDGDLEQFGPVCDVRHNSDLTLLPREMKIQFSEKHLCGLFQEKIQGSLQRSSLPHLLCDTSVQDIKGGGEDIMSCANFASVPPQSSKIAKMIFQRLDRLMSPKKNLSDLKVVARNGSSNLTFGTFEDLNGLHINLPKANDSDHSNSLALPKKNASPTKPSTSFTDIECNVISNAPDFSEAKVAFKDR